MMDKQEFKRILIAIMMDPANGFDFTREGALTLARLMVHKAEERGMTFETALMHIVEEKISTLVWRE